MHVGVWPFGGCAVRTDDEGGIAAVAASACVVLHWLL